MQGLHISKIDLCLFFFKFLIVQVRNKLVPLSSSMSLLTFSYQSFLAFLE